NAATVVLDGANSQVINSATNGDALANFGSNAAAGNITIQNGRDFAPLAAFNNNGNVNIGANSTFTLANGGASTGDWNIVATGSLQFTGGTYLLDDGTDITGPGFAKVVGGTVNGGDAAADVVNIDNLALSGGTLAMTGTLHVTQVMNFTDGTLSGAGDVTVAGLLTWSRGTMTGGG